MKLNLKYRRYIQRAGFVLLLLVLVFSSIAAAHSTMAKSVSQTAIAKYLAAQNNPALGDEDKIKTAIDAYFTTRYEGQRLLVAQDFSPLLEDKSLAWVQKEKDKREIELYIATLFNLRYESYTFTLDYDSIEINKNKAVVQLRQSHQVVYEASAPEISELANLPHTVTLHNKKGVWAIYKDEYQDEYSKLLTVTPKEEIKRQIEENYKISYQNASTIFGVKVLARLMFSPLALTSYSYSRTAAVTFADNNALVSQPPIPQAIKSAYQAIYGQPYPSTWPATYRNEPGTDCTNFISEAIFEGTGYTSGDANYFYPTPNDSNWYYKFSPTAQGSATWVNVGSFYNFLLNRLSRICRDLPRFWREKRAFGEKYPRIWGVPRQL